MSGDTSKIERAIKALEEGQLKAALYLTDKNSLSRHHQWVEEAATKCLTNPNQCKDFREEAIGKLRETITAPMEDTSLEGVKEVIEETRQPGTPPVEPTDEELAESCEECHVAAAVAAAADLCEDYPQTVCSIIAERLENPDVEPEEWLKVLNEAKEKAVGEAKTRMDAIVGDLTKYLERRNSPLLKALKKEPGDGG